MRMFLVLSLSLFQDVQLDSLMGQEGDGGLVSVTNHKHISDSCGECLTVRVLDVGNIEAAGVLLYVLEDTDSTDVVSTSDQDLGSVLELDYCICFSCFKIALD